MSVNSQGIQPPCSEKTLYFFKRYGKAILVGIIVLAGFFYAGYRRRVQQQAQQAQVAAAYAEIVPQLRGEKEKDKEKAEQTEKAIEQFIAQHQDTVYGTLLALEWAKHWVDQQAYDRAAAQLTTALQQSRDSDLQALIRLRLARLQSQLNQPTEALKNLAAIQKQQVWWLPAQALRGDILRSQQDFAGARAAYQQVLNQGDSLLQPLVKLWMNEISDNQEKP